MEITLGSILDLYDKYGTISILTFQIKYGTTPFYRLGRQFHIQESKIDNTVLSIEQIIQEIYQQIFADFTAKQDFKTPIDPGIDKLSHSYLRF